MDKIFELRKAESSKLFNIKSGVYIWYYPLHIKHYDKYIDDSFEDYFLKDYKDYCEITRKEMALNRTAITEFRDSLETELLKLPNASLNGYSENRIYNTTNISFKGQDANVLIGRMRNIAISNGSACSSAVVEPSHVLKAMGLNDDDAFTSVFNRKIQHA